MITSTGKWKPNDGASKAPTTVNSSAGRGALYLTNSPRLLRGQNGQMIEATGGFSLAHVEPESLEDIERNETHRSALLTAQDIDKAYAIVEPAILNKLSSPDSPRNGLHIVVCDPVKVASGLPFSKCVIFERSIGSDNWDIDLKTLARKKAFVSWKHGMDSHDIQQNYPYLYQEGDNKYAGAINRNGLVVSTAGIEWYYDELFSKLIADSCESICKQKMDEIMSNPNIHFVAKSNCTYSEEDIKSEQVTSLSKAS